MKLRRIMAFITVVMMIAVTAVTASASTAPSLSEHSDAIISQFTKAASDIVPIIIGVLGAGLIIFVVFAGIRLAKKMFRTVGS